MVQRKLSHFITRMSCKKDIPGTSHTEECIIKNYIFNLQHNERSPHAKRSAQMHSIMLPEVFEIHLCPQPKDDNKNVL